MIEEARFRQEYAAHVQMPPAPVALFGGPQAAGPPDDPDGWDSRPWSTELDDTFYEIYDASGNLLPNAYAPGTAWLGLVVDNWYHQSITFDLSLNQIISASITDLTSGITTTVDLTNANPPWLMFPSSASAVRFFVGGGTGSNPGNVMAFDNLSITPVGAGN